MPSDQKPVAWMFRGPDGQVELHYSASGSPPEGWTETPLYTRPPASEPVPEVGDDLTAVYLLGKRDGRDEAAALLSAQAAMLDEARKALAFYADHGNWHGTYTVSGTHHAMNEDWADPTDEYPDGKPGKRAREVIAKLEAQSHVG